MKGPNKIQRTAQLMLACLESSESGRVTSTELYDYVRSHDGSTDLIHQGAKLIRDASVMIVSEKARHLSTWELATTEAQIRDWNDRMVHEHYSEKRSQARALYLSKHPLIRKARRDIMVEAVRLGGLLGMDDTTVSMDCRPSPEGVAFFGQHGS